MIDRAIVQAKRDLLAAQLDHGRLAFADLEVQRDQAIRSLAELQRHLDGMVGGIQELDALLAMEGAIVQNGKRNENNDPIHPSRVDSFS